MWIQLTKERVKAMETVLKFCLVGKCGEGSNFHP